jgi:hypothetical protein
MNQARTRMRIRPGSTKGRSTSFSRPALARKTVAFDAPRVRLAPTLPWKGRVGAALLRGTGVG